jgi:hypothetical protein
MEGVVIAYKFLAEGAVGPFSGFRWRAGEWVRAASPRSGEGVHACRARDLPYWVDDELWLVELDGAIRERETQLEADRGRLTERLVAWDARARRAFAEACALRAGKLAAAALGRRAPRALRQANTVEQLLDAVRSLQCGSAFADEMLGYARDATVRALEGNAGSASHTAAVAAEALRGRRASSFARERAWQARWIVRRVGAGTLHCGA